MSEDNKESGSESGETKLYAGKFKTVEELEQGYSNSFKLYEENQKLKTQIEEASKIPTDYLTPESITLHEKDLEKAIQEAKESGMTQKQYEKFIARRHKEVETKVNEFESTKKSIGADTLNQIQDYIKEAYPEAVHQTMIKEAIKNQTVRETLLQQRSKALNSQAPGMGKATSSGAGWREITQADIMKARLEIDKCRGKAKVEATNRYIELQRRKAHANQSA